MALLPGDYTRRTVSTQRNSSISGGTGNELVPIPAGSANFEICQQGTVLHSLSINSTSSSTILFFKDSAGTEELLTPGGLTIARDYKFNFYCPWPLYISTDVGCEATVSASGKNITGQV